ncbi:MAG: ACT domain-containing protein [Coriobacteriia bacterium]|nr:ACT domain-containing protein [Coriobacteriia bacterium]
MIEQVSVFLENSPGHLARLTRTLANANINMRALMVADTENFGVVRIICDTPNAAKEVLESEGFGVSITRVIAVEIPDRPGGLADVLNVLGDAGINVEYAYAFVEPGAKAAVDIFKVDDDRAVRVLASAGMTVIGPERLYAKDAPV